MKKRQNQFANFYEKRQRNRECQSMQRWVEHVNNMIEIFQSTQTMTDLKINHSNGSCPEKMFKQYKPRK